MIRSAGRLTSNKYPVTPPTGWTDIHEVRDPIRQGFLLLLGIVLMLIASKPALFDNADPDLFWHLRVAEQIEQDGVGPLMDGLSFTSIREPWTPYSWLGELAMKWTWDVGAMPGVLVVQTVLLAAFFSLVARTGWELTAPSPGTPGEGRGEGLSDDFGARALTLTLSRSTGRGDRRPLFSIALATAFAAFGSFPYLSFRPAMFALVLLATCAWLFVRDRRLGEASRAVWLVPLLTALCVNVHLYAFFVPALLGLIAIADWLARRQFPRRAFTLATASGVGCLCTPLLPGVVAQAFAYQSSDVMVREGRIAEMQPIWGGMFGWFLIGVSVFAIIRRMSHESSRMDTNQQKVDESFFPFVRIREDSWLLIWGVASLILMLKLGRFVPVAMIGLAPLVALALPRLNDRVLGKPALRLAMACLLVAGIVRIAVTIPQSRDLDAWLIRFGADAPVYPVAAAKYVHEHVAERNGRLVNEFTWGGYLAWRLGDRYQVFVDGRTQLYSESFWRSTHLGTDADVMPVLAASKADAAIVPAAKSRFDGTLRKLGWTEAFRDDVAVVLVPPSVAADAR
jgi:hypothetical protein